MAQALRGSTRGAASAGPRRISARGRVVAEPGRARVAGEGRPPVDAPTADGGSDDGAGSCSLSADGGGGTPGRDRSRSMTRGVGGAPPTGSDGPPPVPSGRPAIGGSEGGQVLAGVPDRVPGAAMRFLSSRKRPGWRPPSPAVPGYRAVSGPSLLPPPGPRPRSPFGSRPGAPARGPGWRRRAIAAAGQGPAPSEHPRAVGGDRLPILPGRTPVA